MPSKSSTITLEAASFVMADNNGLAGTRFGWTSTLCKAFPSRAVEGP